MFQERDAKSGTSASELIRNAMEAYYAEHLRSPGSIFDEAPADLGKPLRPHAPEEDLFEEMLS